MRMLRSALSAGLVAAAPLSVAGLAITAVPASAQNAIDQFEVSFQNREGQRRVAISSSMGFTEDEATQFWPIYDKYRLMTKGFQLRRLKMIRTVAENSVGMEASLATSLLDDALVLEAEQDAAKKAFFRDLAPHFAGARYFRLYEIETKLDAIYKQAWTNQIPLAVTESELEMLQHGLQAKREAEAARRVQEASAPTT